MGYTITKEENDYYRMDAPSGTGWRHFDSEEVAQRWGRESYWRDQSMKRVVGASLKSFSGRQYKRLECGHNVRSEDDDATVLCPHCYRQMAGGRKSPTLHPKLHT